VARQEDLVQLLTRSMNAIPSARFYVFGATGDLVSKRAVRESLVHLAEQGRLNPEQHTLVLMGSKPSSGAAYLERFRTGDADSKKISQEGFEKFKALTVLQDPEANLMGVNLSKIEDFQQLKQDVGQQDAVFLGAVPPKAYPSLLQNIKASGLSEPGTPGGFRRIVLEKPFGENSQAANQLAEIVERDFQPGQVLLIDHFLGYPGMLHLLQFRAAPEVDEALTSRYVERVEVKLLETIKSNDRPYFRDTGILKDMVQNHAMQILSTLAMDIPTTISGDSLRRSRESLVQSVQVEPGTVVRGQFEGFNDPAQGAPADAPPSQAETFVSFDMKVNTPRWEGVAFHLVNAKGVDQKRSGADVHLRSLPEALAARLGLEANQSAILRFTINGQPKIEVEVAGGAVSVPLDSRIVDQPAYSNLLPNAILGETALFATPAEAQAGWRVADEVEAAWQGQPMVSYQVGTPSNQVGKTQA
jgi:glucose-6-phosphate 1-dehydrogenase